MRSLPKSAQVSMIYCIEKSRRRAQAALAQENLRTCFKDIEKCLGDVAPIHGTKDKSQVPIGRFCQVGPLCVPFTGRNAGRVQHSKGVLEVF